MTTSKKCPECAGGNLFERGGVGTRGAYGPDLIPGTSGVFGAARMKVVVCMDCGLARFYAAPETLAKIDTDKGWNRVS